MGQEKRQQVMEILEKRRVPKPGMQKVNAESAAALCWPLEISKSVMFGVDTRNSRGTFCHVSAYIMISVSRTPY